MSRIDRNECSFMDMEWFGVDRAGNIAVFCSAGVGNLPEFVCADKERANALIEYFETAEKISDTILLNKMNMTERFQWVAHDFSDRGLYYFDSDDNTEFGVCRLHEYYTKISIPQNPIKFCSLPEHIQKIMENNLLEIDDFSLINTINVKHAYE